jgi:ribosomal protein L14
LIILTPKLVRTNIKRKHKVKIGTVYKGLLIRTKRFANRVTGQRSAFKDNGAILFGVGPSYLKAGVYIPLSKRIFGPVNFELRYSGFSKMAVMARRPV